MMRVQFGHPQAGPCTSSFQSGGSVRSGSLMIDSIGSQPAVDFIRTQVVGDLLRSCDTKRGVVVFADVLACMQVGLQLARELAGELERFVYEGDFLSVRAGKPQTAFAPLARRRQCF